MASVAEFRPSELVRLLSKASVDYVVVGGVAVVEQEGPERAPALAVAADGVGAGVLGPKRALEARPEPVPERGRDGQRDDVASLISGRHVGNLPCGFKSLPEGANFRGRRRLQAVSIARPEPNLCPRQAPCAPISRLDELETRVAVRDIIVVQVPQIVVRRRGPERAHSSWVSEDRRSRAARWGAWAAKIRRTT